MGRGAYGTRVPTINRELLEWQEFAACKGQWELFFAPPQERREQRLRREMEAKKICAVCPVQEQCLEYAMSHREGDVWGGKSELERALMGAPVVDRSITAHRARLQRS